MKRLLWWLVLFSFALALTVTLSAQEVALTFDDLPAHGPVPEGLSRVEIIKSILKDLKAAHAPQVYGFINAGKLEQAPADLEVLKLWRAAGFPLGNHTYTHPSLNKISAKDFEQNIEKNEAELKSLMDGKDWHWLRKSRSTSRIGHGTILMRDAWRKKMTSQSSNSRRCT